MRFKEQMTDADVIRAVMEVYKEGYGDYATPCNAYNTMESAWAESLARINMVELFGEA